MVGRKPNVVASEGQMSPRRRLYVGPKGLALAAAGWMALGWIVPAWSQLPTTELNSVFPPGGKVGTSFDVRTAGGNQEDVFEMRFSHPGIQAEVKRAPANEFLPEPLPQSGQFTVTIAPDVPPGRYDVWVIGRFGVSNVRTFEVGTRDEWNDDGSNRQKASAKEVTVGTTVNGIADSNSTDYYRIHLAQGQRIIADCVAERIDSKMNATLELYDESGRELKRTLDTVGYDPILDFTAPAEGDYLIAIYDFYYDGGSDYFYRLHFHTDPTIDFVLPPVGVAGTTADFSIYGRNLPGGKPSGIMFQGVELEVAQTQIALPGDLPHLDVVDTLRPQSVGLDAIAYRIGSSDPALISLTTLPVVLEHEPNSDASTPQTLTIPCEVAGQFYPERDWDWYQFEAKKGDVFVLEVISHRLGLPTDAFLMIEKLNTDGEGKVTAANVAQVDDEPNRNNRIGSPFDTSTDDPSYRFVAPDDGTYRVLVFDQFNDARNDPRMVYRLQIRHEKPDFRVYTYAEEIKVANAQQILYASPVVRRGGSVLLKVLTDRIDGFDGDIAIRAEGLPPGVTCRELILSPKQDSGWLSIEAAEGAAPWTGPIRVVGRAAINGADVERQARPGSITWATANNQQVRAEFRLARELYLTVISEVAPAMVQVGEDKIYETSLGGTLEIPVKLTRRNEFKEAIKLVANNIPNELKPADIDIAADKTEGTLKIAVTNGNAKPGLYSFILRADTKCKYSRNPDAVTRVEQQVQKLAEIATQLTEQVKQATAARDTANKAAQDAAAAVKTATAAQAEAAKKLEAAAAAAKQAAEKAAAAKQAADGAPDNAAAAEAAAKAKAEADAAEEQRKQAQAAAEKAQAELAAAQEAQKKADEAKTKAESDLKDVQDRAKRATDTKTALDKQLADVKKANNPADLNIALVSGPIQLRVVPSPLALTVPEGERKVKRTETLEIPIRIERKYGFAEPVELTAELPKNVSGITIEKVSIPGDQSEAKLVIAPNDKATTGTHAITLKVKGQFNKINVESSADLTVEVTE